MITREYLKERGVSDKIINEFNIDISNGMMKIPYDKGSVYRTATHEPIKLTRGSKGALLGSSINSNNIVICEGIFDMLSLQSLGIPSFTNTTGVMATLKVLIPELKTSLKDKNIYILFDYDTAGFKALKKVWQFTKDYPQVRFCYFEKEDGLQIKGDVNDYIMQGSDIKKILNRNHTWQEMEGVTLMDIEFTLDTPTEIHYKPIPKSYNTDMANQLSQAKAVPFTNIATFKNKKTICPWHNDTNATLYLYHETNTVFCPVCDESHDTIDYIQSSSDYAQKTFKEALHYLAPPPTITINRTTFGK